ncbi:F-box protein At2g26160-like [Malus domestica]|uniref:F-box protein At2g26160-like n=1 Tax=Malus domestica TaxID=3750 RepID=UPI0039748EA6
MARSSKGNSFTMVDWSSLPQELVIFIASRIALMEDFVVFGAVCKSWRWAATKENFTSRLTHQVPFLMLPNPKADDAFREFYSLTKDKIHKLNLPEAKGKVCCSSLGWLITSRDLEFRLLHPLDHAHIKLPKLNFSPPTMSYFHWVKKFVLSSSPSWTSDYTIMVLYDGNSLTFCKPGQDKCWTRIVLEVHPVDITYYKGRFYAVTYGGMVLVCDTEDPKQPKTRVVVPEIPIVVKHHSPDKKIYVVESAGDLLVVFSVQEMDNFPIQRPYHTTIREWLRSSQKEYRTTHRQFKVFKVPLSGGSWRLDSEVKKLGNRSLFVGDNNSSFSVEASTYLGCKANCIYYYSYTFREVDRAGLSPLNGNIEMGVFNMEDGSTEQHFGSPNFALEKTNFPSAGTPCAWIQPSF